MNQDSTLFMYIDNGLFGLLTKDSRKTLKFFEQAKLYSTKNKTSLQPIRTPSLYVNILG